MNYFFSLIKEVLFPSSSEEILLKKLNGDFPIHLSTHKLSIDTRTELIVSSLSDYSNKNIVSIIHLLKYKNSTTACEIIAIPLEDFLLSMISQHNIINPGHRLLILPIPLSKSRLRERGFNQVYKVLKCTAKHNPLIADYINDNTLIKILDTKSQTRLSRADRLTNLDGAFACERLNNTDIILIDDVMTTGATIVTATKTLLKAGAKSVQIITFAKTL